MHCQGTQMALRPAVSDMRKAHVHRLGYGTHFGGNSLELRVNDSIPISDRPGGSNKGLWWHCAWVETTSFHAAVCFMEGVRSGPCAAVSVGPLQCQTSSPLP